MRDLKALDPDKAAAYADAYDLFVSEGLRFTAGGAGAINANAKLYDTILNPFGAVDKTQVVFEDLPKNSPHYDAVRLLYEEGIMQAASATRFGVDDEANVGELALALYALGIGDISDPEEALATLQQYGIMAGAGEAGDALSAKTAVQGLKQFTSAVQAEYPSGISAEGETMTRGELADLLMQYLVAMGWVTDD